MASQSTAEEMQDFRDASFESASADLKSAESNGEIHHESTKIPPIHSDSPAKSTRTRVDSQPFYDAIELATIPESDSGRDLVNPEEIAERWVPQDPTPNGTVKDPTASTNIITSIKDAAKENRRLMSSTNNRNSSGAENLLALINNTDSTDDECTEVYRSGDSEKRNSIQRQKSTKSIGNYTFEDDEENVLGRGAFGVVYKGQHVDSAKTVAIKKISVNGVKPEEIESVRQINNPFVVRYEEIIFLHDEIFMVMEVLDGDLSVFIDTNGKLSVRNLETLSKNIAQGYLAIADKKIVHRDLKPQNILLRVSQTKASRAAQPVVPVATGSAVQRRDGTGSPAPPQRRRSSAAAVKRKLSSTILEPIGLAADTQPRIVAAKISDFGCCRQQTENDNLAGTFLYMAPEVGANLVERSEYNQSVDMWSIGVMLYEAITGKIPFEENDLCKLFLRATNQNYAGYQPPPVHTSLQKKYKAVLPRLLQVDPDRRLKPRPFHDHLMYNHPLPAEVLVENDKDSVSRRSFRRQWSGGSKKGSKLKLEQSTNPLVATSNPIVASRSNRTRRWNVAKCLDICLKICCCCCFCCRGKKDT